MSLQGCAALAKNRAVALGVPRVRDWTCRVLRSGLRLFSVGSRPALEVPALRGGGPGVAVWSVKSPEMDSTFGMSSMFARAVLAVYRFSRELGESGVRAPAMLVSEAYLSAMSKSRKGGRDACTGVEIGGVDECRGRLDPGLDLGAAATITNKPI